MYECRKCEQFGLRFERPYRPEQFIEGRPDSRVWIVGLNPAQGVRDKRTTVELAKYFDDPSVIHSYFRDFARVSALLFGGFGKTEGTAHTDLVKCSSQSWPPPDLKLSDRNMIIRNCEGDLLAQIEKYRPALIVCNGSEVSAAIKRLLPPSSLGSECETSYLSTVGDQTICIVLSGSIGRIDNYAKRRLGREIEVRLAELGL